MGVFLNAVVTIHCHQLAARLVSPGMPAATPGHLFEIGRRTDDVHILVAGLRTAGVSILKSPFDSAAGNRLCYIADPDGTWIWPYHDRQASGAG
ncbi:MAG: VOC family protein [Devosia sp.]